MQLPADYAFGKYLPSVDKFTTLCGDFWYRLFQAQKQVRAINGAFQQEYRQFSREILESAAIGGYTTCPQYHTETWWPLLIDPAEIEEAPVRYGDGYFYGGNPDAIANSALIYYGDVKEKWWSMPLPDSVKSAVGASNGTVGDTITEWFPVGIDAQIVSIGPEKKVLQVNKLPGDVFEVYVDQYGNERLLVWLYMAEFERYWTASHYGKIYDRYLPSTPAFLATNRAVFGAYTYGGSELRLRELMAASVNEVVADQYETVEKILDDRKVPAVITDKRTVYGEQGKSVVVSEGDVLSAGDYFFDAVKTTTFEDGVPAWMDSWLFPQGVTGAAEDNVIPSGEHALIAEVRDGYTHISSDVGSNGFWDWVNAGQDFAQYVARYFEISTPSSGVVEPSLFPATFDVLAVLAESPLRYIISVSQIKSEFLVPEAVSLLSLDREVVPPWLAHVTQFDGDPPPGWKPEYDCQPVRAVWV